MIYDGRNMNAPGCNDRRNQNPPSSAFLNYDKTTSKDTCPSKSMFINNKVQLLDDGDSDEPCYKVLDLYLEINQCKSFHRILFDEK